MRLKQSKAINKKEISIMKANLVFPLLKECLRKHTVKFHMSPGTNLNSKLIKRRINQISLN